MGNGWKRAKKALGLRVCTTVHCEPDEDEQPTLVSATASSDAAETETDSSPSTRLCVNLGRRTANSSNPSTPRAQSQSCVSNPTLRCKTGTSGAAGCSNPSLTPSSPKSSSSTLPASIFSPLLQCKTSKSPRMSGLSVPSSPRSPLSLLMSSLRLNRTNCGICTLTTETGQGTAIFTAECSHSFHFACISAYVQKQGSLICPICQLRWKEVPMLQSSALQQLRPWKPMKEVSVYDDDEPLLHANGSGRRFNPIPEVQEEEIDEDRDDEDVDQFKGFPVTGTKIISESDPPRDDRVVKVGVLPDTALVGAGRGYESYALVLRVCAPPLESDPARRAAIDLVTVLDVSGSMSGDKLCMMKRAMRLVISSLVSSDRLSIVAFSSASKRLLQLRRMTPQGQHAARRVVERLICGEGTCVPEALRKAAKVLEDRRERNPVASIMLLSDGHESSPEDTTARSGGITSAGLPPAKTKTTAARFGHVEIPIHNFGFSGCSSRAGEDRFAQCVGRLLSVVVQDLSVQIQPSGCEIDGVYAWHDRPRVLHQLCTSRARSATVPLGDLYVEEEREILVEVRVPAGAVPGNQALAVKCCFRDPVAQRPVYGREQVVVLPSMHPNRTASLKVERLRNRFQTSRAAAQAAHLVELGDLGSAQKVLAAARSALAKSSSLATCEQLQALESELAQVDCRRLPHHQWRQHRHQRRQPERQLLSSQESLAAVHYEDGLDPLTPTSAWRAAERLAKVAVVRKSMHRVRDLHGFEDARF